MQQKRNISLPKKGMKRSVHPSQIEKTEYLFCLNCNLEHETGEQLNVYNESSNYLTVNFPVGFKVLGYRKDVTNNRTIYILTNPTTKKSIIGYVKDVLIDNYNLDEYSECVDCRDGKNNLGVALENTTQEATNTFIQVIDDICLPVGEGLNLDINSPIKFLDVKVEKFGTTIYWNDYRNEPRWLNIDDTKYLFLENTACEDEVVGDCIYVDRLLQFPKHKKMILEAEAVQNGGNLKKGVYTFYGVYCDGLGNEIVNYSSPTQPVRIFDDTNVILDETQLDARTGFAIKVKVKDLDTVNFKYYKVVCLERTDVLQTAAAFVHGVFPTTNDTIIYASSGTSNDAQFISFGNARIPLRIDIQKLFVVKPTYTRAKGNTVIGKRMFQWGLETRREINIQPVVNLFSSLLKWQSTASKETLYKSALAPTGYMRDEVQPVAIRFFYKDGGYSANFPFIGRPSLEGEQDLLTDDTNLNSILTNVRNCVQESRNKKWQIYNTATEIARNEFDIEDAVEVVETLTRDCIVENVFQIPSGTNVPLVIDGNYTNLLDYILENPNVNIPGITEFINPLTPYAGNCQPFFPCGFEGAELQSQVNIPVNVVGEQVSLVKRNIADYRRSVRPQVCGDLVIKTDGSGYERNTEFEQQFMQCVGFPQEPAVAFTRNFNFQNIACTFADDVLDNNNPQQSGIGYFHDTIGATVITTLLTDKNAFVTASNFNAKVHQGGLWFAIKKNNRNSLLLEVTKRANCTANDDVPVGSTVRYTIFPNCTETTPITGGFIDLNNGLLVEINSTSLPDEFFVVIDPPVISVTNCDSQAVFRTAPPCGCYSVYTRNVDFISANVSWTSIQLDKKQTYTKECTTLIPKMSDCEAVPFAYGLPSYWESIDEYSGNKELWDSSTIKIDDAILEELSEEDTDLLFDFYLTQTKDANGNYILKNNTDFRCTPIRHFKFPDNKVSPFMGTYNTPSFTDAIIFPIGFKLDSSVVTAMLKTALKNNLITQKEYDNIEGYEILKADNTVSKSIIGNGLGYDMYSYEREGKNYLYSNYPHNDLGDDILHRQGSNFIKHPYEDVVLQKGGTKNNKYSILSPDLLLNRVALPTEISLSGYQIGHADGRFTQVEDHPKWTILGQQAKNLATTLAIAESVLEVAIKTAEFTTQSGIGNSWFVGGLATGGGITGSISSAISIGIFAAATISGQFLKVGQYRYQWLTTFRDLGAKYNFASINESRGHHNRFIINTDEDEYLRGITTKRILRQGDWIYRDEVTGEDYNINNFQREDAIFVSTGDFFFHYTEQAYQTWDNNKVSRQSSSRTVANENDCKPNIDYVRNVGSPYFTLKNYIPDQFGNVDSLKWLTTGSYYKIGEQTKTIFGGTVFISRFTWKKKLPMFRADAMGTADRTPFSYRAQTTIPNPTYWIDYEVDSTSSVIGSLFPDIDSDYNLDCLNRGFYVRPDSKFYLSYFGVVDFLVESEINCNFRYGRAPLKDQFYPIASVSEMAQPKNIPFSEPNTFFYNNVYSLPTEASPFKILGVDFNKELWEKKYLQENAVIYSAEDLEENSLLDPYLLYRPLDWYEFPSQYGKLKMLKSLENNQVLTIFDNEQVIFNAVDNLADRITPQNAELGTAGIFATRPQQIKTTDLGFAGTQHSEILSIPYGKVTVDAKRGKVFLNNGTSIEIISDRNGQEESGMRQWFLEQLPFKILKYFPNADIDNKFKGLGLSLGWDSKFERIFITKKDYIPKSNCITYQDGEFFYNQTECDDVPQVIVCQEGFTYNPVTEFCERMSSTNTDTDIIFVMDNSDSMSNTEVNQLNNLVQEIVTQLESGILSGNIKVSIIKFAQTAENRQSLTSDLSLISSAIFSPRLTGTTNILQGLCLTKTELETNARPLANKRVILIADGINNMVTNSCGIVNSSQGIFDLGETIKNQGAEITVIGIGTEQEQTAVINAYGGTDENPSFDNYPLSSIGGGINGFSSFKTDFSTALNIVEDIVGEIVVIEQVEPTIEDSLLQVDLTNPTYFEDVSWTVAYKLTTGTWISYYSFKPNLYVSHQEYFETSNNDGTLWQHPLSNKSFQVFYGNLHPFIVESIIQNEGGYKMLNNISIDVEGRRYQNKWDFSQWKGIGFNKLNIYNATNNSGLLELDEKTHFGQEKNYPQTNGNIQKILFTPTEGKHNINYFFNRVRNQDNNIPQWLWDKTMINKTINPQAVSFKGKQVLERLRGNWFVLRMINDKESRFSINLKGVEIVETQKQ